jgi:hypothetical protein
MDRNQWLRTQEDKQRDKTSRPAPTHDKPTLDYHIFFFLCRTNKDEQQPKGNEEDGEKEDVPGR